MNREEIMEDVKRHMPAVRWQHTAGVMETAVRLAQQYGADPQKAELAAILHDCCKYWPVNKQADVIRDHGLSDDVLQYDKELWHAIAGAWVAEQKYNVADIEVIEAIRYHTTGRPGMTLLDKVVCLADYIEPGRNYPNVNIIRELAEDSLEKALIAGFDSTIQFLLNQGKKIYPLTVITRNDLLQSLPD